MDFHPQGCKDRCLVTLLPVVVRGGAGGLHIGCSWLESGFQTATLCNIVSTLKRNLTKIHQSKEILRGTKENRRMDDMFFQNKTDIPK